MLHALGRLQAFCLINLPAEQGVGPAKLVGLTLTARGRCKAKDDTVDDTNPALPIKRNIPEFP